MKTRSPSLHFIFPVLFLCLTAILSERVLAASHEIQLLPHENSKVCITGWLPLQHRQNSSCLQVISCFDESDNKNNDKEALPGFTERTCPEDLHHAITANPNVTAMVNIHTNNGTRSEYISTTSHQESSSWFYGWSAANFGMSLLHIFKANQKATLAYNGKASRKASNRNIYFFVSYMIGAFHHIVEMPVTQVGHIINWVPHLIIHSGTLVLSILERLMDCNCCSQFKNGHNTMIAFHLVALTFAALW